MSEIVDLNSAREHADKQRRRLPLAPDGGGPHDPGMEARVAQLEKDTSEIKATLNRLEPMIVRIDAAIPFLATKAEVHELRGEMSEKIEGVRGDLTGNAERNRGELMVALERKPSRAAMWTMGLTLFALSTAAFVGGIATLPILAHWLGWAGQ